MYRRLLACVWTCGAIVLLGCVEPLVEGSDERTTSHLPASHLPLAEHGQVLIGQDGIDFWRRITEKDLDAVLKADPNHPSADSIRKRLADLDWQERLLRFRIANGFHGPGALYTEEEFYRRMIEEREMLQLTDEQVEAVRVHLDSISDASLNER